jgi:uncharacterized membrane protein
LFPRKSAELIGVKPTDTAALIMRGIGVREVASAAGILCQPSWRGWPWVRIAGDAMDLGLLQSALAHGSVRHERRFTVAAATLAGITATDIAAGNGPTHRSAPFDPPLVSAAVTVNRSVEDVYGFWWNIENFPRFMANVESVRLLDGRRSHWRAIGPAGSTVEWDAEIVEDRPNERIAWQAVPGSDVWNAGTVSFQPAPGHRGTELRVEMSYEPPAGSVGRVVASLFGKEPGQEVRSDLRRLKSILETGEVIASDATLEGRSIKQGPAQPADYVRQYLARAR